MATTAGMGHHLKSLRADHIVRYSKLTFSAQVLYALSLGCVKISIVWMLKKLFPTTGFQRAAWIIMALSIAWMLQTILIGIFLCQPTSLNWDPDTRGHCGNQTMAYSSVSILDFITDALIMVLPIRLILHLQIKKVHKIALICIFGAGAV